jgi:HSP20 family protein
MFPVREIVSARRWMSVFLTSPWTRLGLPGVKKENIQLEAEGQILRISVCEDKQEEKEETRSGITWHRVERSCNFNSRALRFPDAADLSKVQANVENGVLRVCIAKRPETQQQRKAIAVA